MLTLLFIDDLSDDSAEGGADAKAVAAHAGGDDEAFQIGDSVDDGDDIRHRIDHARPGIQYGGDANLWESLREALLHHLDLTFGGGGIEDAGEFERGDLIGAPVALHSPGIR